jgi:hypothetical protein
MSKLRDLDLFKIRKYSSLNIEIEETKLRLEGYDIFYKMLNERVYREPIFKKNISKIEDIRKNLIDLIFYEKQEESSLIKKRKILESSLKNNINRIKLEEFKE